MLPYTIFTIWINNIQNEEKYIPLKSVIELEKLSRSILEAFSTGRIVKSKEMEKIWPWNIQYDSAKSRWCYNWTRNLKGDWNTLKKVNHFLLSLLLFQATSFIQKMITQLLKKLIFIRVNTRKFSCYTEKTCRLSPFVLFFWWIVCLCYISVTTLVLKYR